MTKKINYLRCLNCQMVMVNKNGNVRYCKPCRQVQQNYRKMINFIDTDFNKLHIEKKMELFNKMIMLDPSIVWRKILT